ncbi:MAG: GTPase Era, partial [Clostridiales bacterium]
MVSKKPNGFKSGFVTLIGRPNVGKSTLLNQLLGQKVAIISDKPQTTRNSIRGIYNSEDMQAIFVDTPGIHKPKYKLDERMMQSARDSLLSGDIIFYLVDVTSSFGKGEEYIINQFSQIETPVFLLLNKIDLVTKEKLFPLLDSYSKKYAFQEIFPICATTGENTDRLLTIMKNYLPEGPQYYPDDLISDQPEQQLLAELIREQVLLATEEEIPHSTAVNITDMEERENGLLYVGANIYVERDSQKGIIIGKRGAMLQKIGKGARLEMEKIFACRVFLDLRVRAKKDWRNNERLL